MMIANLESGCVLHLSIHTEEDGRELASLWDTEEQAKKGGTYVPLWLTDEQLQKLSEAIDD